MRPDDIHAAAEEMTMKNIVMKALPLLLVIASVVSTSACPSDSAEGEGEGETEGQ